jgi:hypothetical protein
MRKQLAVSFTVNQEQSEDDTLYVEQDFPRFREEVTDIMVKRGWNSCMFASCTTDKRVTASVIMFPKTDLLELINILRRLTGELERTRQDEGLL